MYSVKFLFAVIFLTFFQSSCAKKNGGPDKENPGINWDKVKGNSIQIDPSVLYSSGISPEQLIKDLKKANIKSVHFFVVGNWDGSVNKDLFRTDYIRALKENDIAMWIMMLGNCFYTKPDLPQEWEMHTLTPYPGVWFYTLHHPDFVKWQADRVRRVIRNYPEFIGVEYAESYFPEWKTLETNGFYGDVGAYALNKFSKEYLKSTKVYSFDEVRNNAALYTKWQDFRADAVLNFNYQIKKAIKETNPDVLFAAWGMGVRNGSLAEIRESFGLDMVRIAREVKPDILFIQTAAQDWGDENLKSDYLKQYEYIFSALKKAVPEIKLGVQADIASLSYHNTNVKKRDGTWWKAFMDNATSLGYFTNTAYEYSFYKKQGLWIN